MSAVGFGKVDVVLEKRGYIVYGVVHSLCGSSFGVYSMNIHH